MKKKDPGEFQMDIMDHLRELRKRLLWSIAFLIIGSCVTYSYSELVFSLLSQPYFDSFKGGELIGTGPAEAWMIKLKVSIFSGAILVFPLLFHQFWLFIAPGLYDYERKMVIPFILLSSFLFAGGVYFCYEVVLPFTFSFFSEQYSSIGLKPQIRMSEHLSMMVTALLSFGAIFEMPLLTYFLARLGVVDHGMLIRGSRVAVLIIFIVAAVLTPPDVLTQFLMAGPLLILYAISIGVAWFAASPEEASSSELIVSDDSESSDEADADK